MSLASIRNGLYATLTACGPYAASEISTCGFGVLDVASVCAITYFPDQTSTIDPATFSVGMIGAGGVSQHHRLWNIGGTVWIKADGDPAQVLAHLWQAHDDIYNTLIKDESLGGTALIATLRSLRTQFGVFWKVGGHTWKTVDWVLIAEELN
jgi:hypothetical protein